MDSKKMLMSCLVVICFASAVQASIVINAPAGVTIDTLFISTSDQDSILGSGPYQKGDIVKIDVATATASLYFQGSQHFSATENVDAISLTGDGKIILSTSDSAWLPSVGTFKKGDLVLYDPNTGNASMFFHGSDLIYRYSSGCKYYDRQLDSAILLDDGTIVFSVSGDNTYRLNKLSSGYISFDKNDLVAYKAGSDPYIYFDGGAHGITKDIDAAAILPNGDLVFSLASNTSSPISANDEDLILYSILGNSFSLFLDSYEQLHMACGDEDIDALDIIATWSEEHHEDNPVPEPLSCTLFGLSILGGLTVWRRRK